MWCINIYGIIRLVIITVTVQQIQTEVFLFGWTSTLIKYHKMFWRCIKWFIEVKQAETIVNTGLIFDNKSAWM